MDANVLLNNIPERIFKIKGHDNIYFDLDRMSITRAGDFRQESEEEFIEFSYNIIKGSFLNSNKIEYLFVLNIKEICSFFSHSENYGNTTLIYVFNEDYKQISEAKFQDYSTHLLDVKDINNDGISEVFMEGSYGQMGCSESWIMIFSRNFELPALRVVNYHSCVNSGVNSEKIVLNSTYTVFDKKILFNSSLEYYVVMGFNKDDEIDKRFLKTEYRRDIYEFKKDTFIHIPEKENVDWDDERLEF